MSTAVEKTKKAEVVVNGDPDVGSMIHLAIERGVPVETLEKLMDLYERVGARNARAAFFNALAAFQEEVTEIPKARTAEIRTGAGTKYSYNYAPLEAITRTIRPALRKHGLSYSWTTEAGESGTLNVVCILRHIDGHEERATFPVPTDTKAAMSDAQKNGAALTYGKRQSLTSVLGLTAADPDDIDGAGPAEPITDEQRADLNALIDEVKADRNKICEWLGVPGIPAINQAQLSRLLPELEKKRGKQ